MVPEMEKPRVTEIRVRMDCNGCVQKIKKALHGITGIYDLYIDFPQQKITVIGWAEPEKIVKAIKKTRKSAIICSHAEQSDQPAQETEPAPEGGGPPPESASAQTEQPPAEAEAPKESPPPPENPPAEEKPAPEPANETSQSSQQPKPKEAEEIHVIHHHPPDYGYRYANGQYDQPGVGGQWNSNPIGPGFRGEPPQPVHVAHSYNTYKPSPYVTEYTYLHSPPGFRGEPPQPVHVAHSYNTYKPSPYVTEYAYPHSPPGYTHYSRPEQYNQVYYSGNNSNSNGNGNGSITSMFSEENPNACNIV